MRIVMGAWQRKMSNEQRDSGRSIHCAPCGALAGKALAQGQETEFKSNADDVKKIRSLLEEFRQDIIHKDGYALTKLVFNYDFVINDKVHHSGLEVWQVCKIDGRWKILSVVWTSYEVKN